MLKSELISSYLDQNGYLIVVSTIREERRRILPEYRRDNLPEAPMMEMEASRLPELREMIWKVKELRDQGYRLLAACGMAGTSEQDYQEISLRV
jgi:hypothetical protein